MLKKIVIFCLFLPVVGYGQNFNNQLPQNKDVVTNFMQLSPKQLFDAANYYFNKHSYDTALFLYNLRINTTQNNSVKEQKEELLVSYNRLANIYLSFSDYHTAHDNFTKALDICEKYNLVAEKSRIYLNLGVVYYNLNQYDTTKQYYLKALELSPDSAITILILNNLGANEIVNGEPDSAFSYIHKALQISKQHNDLHLSGIMNNLASYYQNKKLYDSAFYYFRASLYNSRINNEIEKEASFLSDIGKLFFEVNEIDSALYYIDLSNKIASRNKFLKTLTNNISKTNQQIEELIIDRKIKENTIHYQRIIQRIIIIALLMLIIVLFIILYQNKKLKTAYNLLFDKNVKLIKLQEKPSEKDKKNNTVSNTFDDIMSRILAVMEDPEIYCDPSLTVDKLASLTQSNHSYISQAIKNSSYKNYRAFVNSYRIRDAQRFFMEPDAERYTIEYISEKVGYKSRSVFYDAFKEVTGVSPNFYIKSMKKQY